MEIKMTVQMGDGQEFSITSVFPTEDAVTHEMRHLLERNGRALAKTAILALEAKAPKAKWDELYEIAKQDLGFLESRTGIKVAEAV